MLARMMALRLASLSLAVCLAASAQAADPIGLFDSHGDVGDTRLAGSAEFRGGAYRITGGGANLWGAEDAFHFVWKRVSGDVALSADVRFLGEGIDPHRKAVLIIRQDLTPGSAYASMAVHGDGLTALQFRPRAGALTGEIRSEVKAPAKIRLERRGNEFRAWAGDEPAGPQVVEMSGPVYAGLGVCSHNVSVLETAVFSNVRLESRSADSTLPAPRR